MNSDPLVIVSCDGHIGPPVAQYEQYLDEKYRYLMPELLEAEEVWTRFRKIVVDTSPERLAQMDPRKRIESGGYDGSWNVERRLKEMDAEGVAAEIVNPGVMEAMTPFFYQFNLPYSADVRWAGIKAYHRWAADAIAHSNGRLIGSAEAGPSLDMDETIKELRFVAERGFRSVFVPGFIIDPAAPLPPLFDAHYESFWAACNDMQMVLMLHAGWNMKQGTVFEQVRLFEDLKRQSDEAGGQSMDLMEGLFKAADMLSEKNPESPFSMQLQPQQAIWQLIFSGVFDRYPNLKVMLSECRGDWVEAWKEHVDAHFMASSSRPKIKMKPSEYFGKNVFVAVASPRRHEVVDRHKIGVENFLFGADYPHPEGTWPNTLEWLRACFYDVPENELRAIMGETAGRVLGLDQAWLAGIANRINAPKPSDIIGDYHVDERLIADFNKRSFFDQASPSFVNLIGPRIDSDLQAMAV